MDRKRIEDEHIVARYLADQLTPAQAEEFEAYYTQHPSMVREIEYALRLKEGLATLRDRGQLEALAHARYSRWSVPVSIAAFFAAALVIGWTLLRPVETSPVARTLEDLVAEAKTPLPLGGKYLLVRTRSADQILQIALPAARSALELQMLPSGGTAGAPYRMTLLRVSADGEAERIGETSDLGVGPDGLVTTWLDSATLQPGRLAVELSPAQSQTPSDRFLIELR